MSLEGIAQKIIKKMKEDKKVSSFNFENKKYIEKIRYVKDNFARELKEKGVTISIVKVEYSIEIN